MDIFLLLLHFLHALWGEWRDMRYRSYKKGFQYPLVCVPSIRYMLLLGHYYVHQCLENATPTAFKSQLKDYSTAPNQLYELETQSNSLLKVLIQLVCFKTQYFVYIIIILFYLWQALLPSISCCLSPCMHFFMLYFLYVYCYFAAGVKLYIFSKLI